MTSQQYTQDNKAKWQGCKVATMVDRYGISVSQINTNIFRW